MAENPNTKSIERFYTVLRIIGVLILVLFIAGLLVLLFTGWNSPDVRSLVMDHFRTIVALPAAGIFALLIVSIFQVTSGNIEFEALGLKLKGAAGPILMWIIAYIVIVASVHLLW